MLRRNSWRAAQSRLAHWVLKHAKLCGAIEMLSNHDATLQDAEVVTVACIFLNIACVPHSVFACPNRGTYPWATVHRRVGTVDVCETRF